MNPRDFARRELLQGSAALAGLALLQSPFLAHALPADRARKSCRG